MSDLYSELLVKKESTAKDGIMKYGLIVLTALAVLAGIFVNPLILLVAVVLGIACYFVIPKTDVEYEYLFVNGEFDIDMVMAKSKRKRVKSFNLSEADLVAPLNSHRMDYYNGNQNMKMWVGDAAVSPVGLMYRKIANHAVRDKVFLYKFSCQCDVLF